MVFLFELGGKKELSIPFIMGVILFAVTGSNSILTATIAYVVFATLLGDYHKKLQKEIEKEEIKYEKFFEIVGLLLQNRLYVKENEQMKLLRGLLISTLFLLASMIYLTYSSTQYLISNFSITNISLILLITTAYSLYSIVNYILMVPATMVFEVAIDKVTYRLSGNKNDELEEAALD